MIKNASIILLFNIFLLSGAASAATVQDVESGMEIAPSSDTEGSAQVKKEAAPDDTSSVTVKSDQGEEVSTSAHSATGTSEDAMAIERAKQQAAMEMAARTRAAQREAAREMAARTRAAQKEAAREMSARVRAAQEEAAREMSARVRAAKEEAAKEMAARVRVAREEAAKQMAARVRAAQEQAAVEMAERARERAAREKA